jgi:hypothetical protein
MAAMQFRMLGRGSLALIVVAGSGAACSARRDGGADAGADVAREHSYDDASRPGTLGEPLTGPGRQWTWVSFPESHCRDGSTTGIGLNLSAGSKNVVVFLDQGGACFDPLTCAQNANAYDDAAFAFDVNRHWFDTGIFNRADPDNPARDWSFVLVPYCTGDVHAGNQPGGQIPNVGPQQFVGYHNLDLFLSRVVPTFIDAQQVLFAGSSAGGFGVLLNADHVARWFSPIPITVISDSGPPMPTTAVAPCLEKRWLDTWGFAGGPMLDCGVDCPSSSDYMIDQVRHFGWRYPSYRGGLISSTADETIRTFFSFGANDCNPDHIGADGFSADAYLTGLTRLRDTMTAEHAPFGTFLLGNQTRHIWLMDDIPFAASVGGTSLKQWVTGLLNGSVTNVGP